MKTPTELRAWRASWSTPVVVGMQEVNGFPMRVFRRRFPNIDAAQRARPEPPTLVEVSEPRSLLARLFRR